MEFIVSYEELKRNQERAIARERQERLNSIEAKANRQYERIKLATEKACWFFMGVSFVAIVLQIMA